MKSQPQISEKIFLYRWQKRGILIELPSGLVGIIYTIIEKIVFDFIQNKVGFWILKIED